jgi:hypothetical protein
MYSPSRRRERRADVVEMAGGSVRCMIAGIHLAARGTATNQPCSPAM